MTIWIVEDDDNDARSALEAIERVGSGEPSTVLRDRTIQWNDGLNRIPAQAGENPLCKLDHMPDIVILDLMDSNGKFAAEKFYGELRKEERDSGLPASFIIMWSVKTGLPDVHQFLGTKLNIDRRLMFTSTKTIPALEDHLARCLKSWREARYL